MKIFKNWRLLVLAAALLAIFIYIVIRYAAYVGTTGLMAIIISAGTLVYFIYAASQLKNGR